MDAVDKSALICLVCAGPPIVALFMYIFIPTLGYRRLSPDANIHYYQAYREGRYISPGMYCSEVDDEAALREYANKYWRPDWLAANKRDAARRNQVAQRAARDAQRTNN